MTTTSLPDTVENSNEHDVENSTVDKVIDADTVVEDTEIMQQDIVTMTNDDDTADDAASAVQLEDSSSNEDVSVDADKEEAGMVETSVESSSTVTVSGTAGVGNGNNGINSTNSTSINHTSSLIRHILHKFVSKVSADILSAADSTQGSYSVWTLFGLNSGSPSAKDVRRRQCAVSLERLGKALLHIGSSSSSYNSAVKNKNSINEDDDEISERRKRANEEWDERNCINLVGLFVHVLCTWTGLSLVSSEDGAFVYEDNFGNSGEDSEIFQLDMIQEMGVEPHQLARCINCAQELVAHGCMDGIAIPIKVAQNKTDRVNAMHRYLPKSMMKKSDSEDGMNGEGSLLKQAASSHSLQDDAQENKTFESEDVEAIKYDTIEILAVDRIADAVFSADLSSEDVELSALKFLLTAASRTINIPQEMGKNDMYGSSNAMIRGNRLLWALKILYHVFLRTTSIPNRTTARAALEQIVNSVFSRMETSNVSSIPAQGEIPSVLLVGPLELKEEEKKTSAEVTLVCVYSSVWDSLGYKSVELVNDSKPSFPSLNHKDAFIVFRSLCKLAIKSHKSASLDTLTERQDDDDRTYGGIYVGEDLGSENTKSPPTLRSKILSLELLLSILDDPGSELRNCQFFKYAVRQYLCVALLKNFTSNVTRVVGLSLRLFVPIIRHYRGGLKTELEAFVTNVFFVILDSPNSNIEHKGLVVTLFKEICSDPSTLAEIFLNYDCDMSAVDLFHRIVSRLARTAKGTLTQEEQDTVNSHLVVAATGIEKLASIRQRQRSLRLSAMKALRQILASLYSCMIVVIDPKTVTPRLQGQDQAEYDEDFMVNSPPAPERSSSLIISNESKRNLVEIYDSKRRMKESLDEIVLRFNQKPSAGIKYAGQINFMQADNPLSVANFLLQNKDRLEKTQIGELLGREADYQNGFYIRVLQAYVLTFSFHDMALDEAIRLFLSGFRLPGEAQKIDRIMEKFAERYCTQNPHIFPTADAAFILSFSIIMLNTDLHNPAIKPERRMTKEGFIRNNRGICNGSDLPSEMLIEIFERIQVNQISLKEDDEAREKRQSDGNTAATGGIVSIASPGVLFGTHLDEINRRKANKFLKETDQMLRETEDVLTGQRRNNRSKLLKRSGASFVRTKDSGLRDEYVSPMFEVTWGAALAVFSTALESVNGTTHSAQWAEATEIERYSMNRNAISMTEVCLSGFRFAICVAGLCGHEIARNSYVNALANFSQVGVSGRLLEHRHIRCIQILLKIARDDGGCLGNSWGRVFFAMSEVARLQRLLDKLARVKIRNRREQVLWNDANDGDDDDDLSYQSDGNFETVIDDVELDDDLDRRTIDELNAKAIQDAISSELIDTIYLRSSLLTDANIKEFVQQLCRVSRSEIIGSNDSRNGDNLSTSHSHHQPVIYSLQRLVEVAHYNMDTRLLCVWGDIWSTISSHLVDTALHPTNEAVSIYAVDSLRQLSIQYLQRKELGIFEFQRRFLKPYEVIMSRCVFPAPRELLLKGVEQILLVCGGGGTDSITSNQPSGPENIAVNNTLRSGWRPILVVLGQAAHDSEDSIASMGFRMLHNLLDELKKDVAKACLSLGIIGKVNSKEADSHAEYSHCHGYLMAEHFVDLVESLTKFISCPRESLAKKALAYLVMMSDWLGNERNPKPVSGTALNKLRSRTQDYILNGNTHEGINIETTATVEPARSNELELWWPLLLGFSQSVGDDRYSIRSNALVILMKIINRDFLPVPNKNDEEIRGTESDLIALQLIFRGILHPILEFANITDSPVRTSLYLPRDYTYLISPQPSPSRKSEKVYNSESTGNWIESTFDKYMDSCIALCNRASDYFHNSCIVDEVVSIVGACLQSDSWILRVRGLKYLENFLNIDDPLLGELSDHTKAHIANLLHRNLTLSLNYTSDENVISLVVQRYSGSYLVRIASMLLLGESQVEKNSNTLILSERLYLANGLASYIQNWESVAKLPEFSDEDQNCTMFTPPHPLENAVYGRKLMIQLILDLASEEGGFHSSEEAALAQELVVNQTHAFFNAFLEKETAMTDEPRDPITEACHIVELGHMTSFVCDLLDGYTKVSDASFFSLTWLKPMLSSLIESNTKPVRVSVQNLISRLFEGPPESLQPVSPFRVLTE